MQNALLTVQEVAKRLKCHPHTVRRWIWGKKLAAIRVGDLVRVSEEELSNFVRPSRKPKGRGRVRRPARGALALIATMRSLRKTVRRADVEELERLISEGEQPAVWRDPLA